MDGLQRILLFTESKSIARRSESTAVLQIIQQSIEFTVYNIGLSLVNNQTRTPILYMALTSSGLTKDYLLDYFDYLDYLDFVLIYIFGIIIGVIWESRKAEHKRFKASNIENSDELEILYQKFLQEKEIEPNTEGVYTIDDKQEVNTIFIEFFFFFVFFFIFLII